MSAKAKIVALLVSVSIVTAYAADWPGYLGPRRDGTSSSAASRFPTPSTRVRGACS